MKYKCNHLLLLKIKTDVAYIHETFFSLFSLLSSLIMFSFIFIFFSVLFCGVQGATQSNLGWQSKHDSRVTESHLGPKKRKKRVDCIGIPFSHSQWLVATQVDVIYFYFYHLRWLYLLLCFLVNFVNEQELLGYVDITLGDVVRNKRINEKYHLIDSKNGRLQVELQWRT